MAVMYSLPNMVKSLATRSPGQGGWTMLSRDISRLEMRRHEDCIHKYTQAFSKRQILQEAVFHETLTFAQKEMKNFPEKSL